MLTALKLRLKLRRLLDRLATQPDFTERDYLSLSEVIRVAFPPESRLAATFGLLSTKYEAAREQGDPAKVLKSNRKELTAIAASARELIDQSITLQKDIRERDNYEALQIVNQAYFESSLFTATKWILAASLLLLGIGSLGFAGFNIYAQKQLQDAQKTLTETSAQIDKMTGTLQGQQNDLQRKQAETIINVEKMIRDIGSEAKGTLDAQLANINTELTNRMKDAEKFIDGRKEAMNKALTEFGQEARGKVDSSVAGALNDIATTKTTGINAVEAATETAQPAIAQKSEEFVNRVNAAGVSVEALKTKFAADLDAMLANAKLKIDNTVPQQLSKVESAANDGVHRVEGEIHFRLRDLMQRADASLNEALTEKLAELNTKSREAKEAIAIVEDSVTKRETEFTDAMNGRLAAWDQRADGKFERVDYLTKALNDLDNGTKDMDRRLEELQASSKAAFEVADQLRAGTKTGELPLIGTVLEKSATLFVASLVIAFLALAFAVAGLLVSVLYRNRREAPVA